ncbi:sensor histidine kinase [Thalassotalea sp. LPB0316]|uniref:GAF domain-containing sensor histidine kinase n=1 Tax=Thalassotalea sp. LPB0316 TaxID=2769490 RepID=UPI001866A8EC|nr:ATP-binding protein [Thalassotalea sp. LPB0316]QOL25113.1 sensor histidine kinase [Thalassotalea sp. LPB0316]
MQNVNEQISNIISNLKSSWGDDFYSHLLLQLNSVIKADYLFIAKLNDAQDMSTTICLVAGNEVVDNFSYDLLDTPCADVSDDSVCVYQSGVCNFYPKDQLLVDMGIDAYIGTPIHESSGNTVTGIIVALYKNEIKDTDWIVNLFTLFSGRISAEMERQQKEKELIALNEELEHIVEERTKALQASVDNLKNTQKQLVEQEKMASLGQLVAGVAHEINTPLGVAVLCNSNIGEHALELKKKTDEGQLTKQDLIKITDSIIKSHNALTTNLDRAADLISDFKLVAVERSSDDIIEIALNKWFETILSSLKILLRKAHIELTFNKLPSDIVIKTIPSKLGQVVTNIVTNAINHAFEEIKTPRLEVNLSNTPEKVLIEVKDNGVGMTEEMLKNIYEPFYTTKRGCGGTGLGLNIVYGIVNGALNGEISVSSSPGEGTSFVISLPQDCSN